MNGERQPQTEHFTRQVSTPLDNIDIDAVSVASHELHDMLMDGESPERTWLVRFTAQVEQLTTWSRILYSALMAVRSMTDQIRGSETRGQDVTLWGKQFINRTGHCGAFVGAPVPHPEDAGYQADKQVLTQATSALTAARTAFRDIAKWSSDPRVRDEAQRMIEILKREM